MAEFGLLNWAILVIYVIANLLLGYVLGKKINTAQDFFLGNKTTPWCANTPCGRASWQRMGSPSGPSPRSPVPNTVSIIPVARRMRRIAWFSVSTMYRL